MTNTLLRRWLREPLLQFFVIGAVFFFVYSVVRGGSHSAPQDITVSETQVAAMVASFTRTWMRPPAPQELRGLIDDYVKEEIYSREAVALGLDRDDAVIRRRLRQKMEFLSEDSTTRAEPTTAQLQDFLQQHADKFATPARFTFQQVFVNVDRRGTIAQQEAKQLLAKLQKENGAAAPANMGDVSMLPAAVEAASSAEIAANFGAEFAEQLAPLVIGQWTGPLQSAFGLHLVRVTEYVAGALPTLADIRAAVLSDWQTEQRRLGSEAFYKNLQSKYTIRYTDPVDKALHSSRAVTAQ